MESRQDTRQDGDRLETGHTKYNVIFTTLIAPTCCVGLTACSANLDRAEYTSVDGISGPPDCLQPC